VQNALAFGLCDCLDASLRDSARAVALAKEAVATAPQERDGWIALGFARYRAGQWSESRAALEHGLAPSNDADPRAWLLLALVGSKDGHVPEARGWYDKSAHWFENHPLTDELCHLRCEAAEALGIRWP
jgi:hypothetical protein